MDSQLLPKAQLDILQYLYRFRFLNSSQLQRLLNHNNIRLTNYHLKNLITHNYIGKHYSRSLGLANIPAVYYLSSGSIKVLSDSPNFDKRALKTIYREKIRSQQFITHSSFVAEYFLYLRGESEKSKHTLHFFTKTDLLAHPYLIHPLPDAYFARVDAKGDTKRYLSVVEDSFLALPYANELNNTVIISMMVSLQRPLATIFQPLFICPGYASLIYLKKHISRIYEETSLDQIEIFIATKEGAFAGKWEKVEGEDE